MRDTFFLFAFQTEKDSQITDGVFTMVYARNSRIAAVKAHKYISKILSSDKKHYYKNRYIRSALESVTASHTHTFFEKSFQTFGGPEFSVRSGQITAQGHLMFLGISKDDE